MTLPRSLSTTLAAAVATIALGLPSAAHATSMSSHTVVFTLDFIGATYEDDSSPADLQGVGFFDDLIGTFEVGTASQSGSTSFTVNGFTVDPDEFDFATGDILEVTIQADTSADGLGSAATHSRDAIFDFEFEDLDDGTRNILLDFDWSYTQDFSLTNMTAGDQSAAFLDATAMIENFESHSEFFFFVEDENFGNFNANTFMDSRMDTGAFQLFMDVEDGGATSSVVEIIIDVTANNIINVPEPSLAAMLGSITLLLMLGAPRQR